MFRTVLRTCASCCLIGIAALACTEFEPGTDELTENGGVADTSAGALMPAVGRDWTCLGELRAEPMVARDNINPARLVQSVQVLTLREGLVPPESVVRACAQRDLACDNPLTPSLPVDAQGWVDMPLFDGFDGYLEVTSPSTVPMMLFYQEPLRGTSRIDGEPLAQLEVPVLAQLSAALGSPQQAELGLLILRAFDCNGDGAPGVRFTVDRPGVPYYFVAGLPSSMVTETDGSGLGGFLNVPIGITVVDGALTSGEADFTLPRTLFTRPGWMTALRWIAKDMFPADAPSAPPLR